MTPWRAQETQWLQPEWPAPSGVRALCSTRSGGVSQPPYNDLNLGSHVGDQAVHVQQNRARFTAALRGATPFFLNQVHGSDVLELGPLTPQNLTADGACTRERGLACSIMVADCLPVLLCDSRGTMVGAAHAGWRGLAGCGGVGVLEQMYKRFEALAPVHDAQGAIELIAWLGPCIGPSAFEVGVDVVHSFASACPDSARHFAVWGHGKYLADLPGLARQRLAALGVTQVYGNDGTAAWCTVSNPSRFFSHRRDRVTGRQAACIWLE